MNHIVNYFIQSTSHSISSHSNTSHKTISHQAMPLSQHQLSQLALQQQQLIQVLAHDTSKAFCLNTLRSKQIDFLNLGGVVYCPSLQLILQFQARQLVGFQVLKSEVNSIFLA